MAQRDNKKSFKDRAQEAIQGVVEALESLLPTPAPRLVPARANGARHVQRPRGRRLR